MKIDGNMLSAYALGRQRTASGDNSLSGGMGGGGNSAARNIPTIEPSATIPSNLANALWLNSTKEEKAEAASDKVLGEFMDLAKMSPIERLRKELLESLGLTEETLARLPVEERAAIEEQIRRAIKERLGVDGTEQAGATGGQPAVGTEEAKV